MPSRMRGAGWTMLIALVVVAAPPGRIDAAEEGTTEWLEEITTKCEGGTVTREIAPGADGANISVPRCYCDYSLSGIKNWLSRQAEEWKSTKAQPPASLSSFVPKLRVPPGEQRELTLYCLSPGQVASYRSAILAAEGRPPAQQP